ncbi:hypothetical protein ACQ4PT_057141 [Festuca glaucescens]
MATTAPLRRSSGSGGGRSSPLVEAGGCSTRGFREGAGGGCGAGARAPESTCRASTDSSGTEIPDLAMLKVYMYINVRYNGIVNQVQGLDPKSTADFFSNAAWTGEETVDSEDCFVLRVDAELSALDAWSTADVEVIQHALWGYFSQRTGLLVRLYTHLH